MKVWTALTFLFFYSFALICLFAGLFLVEERGWSPWWVTLFVVLPVALSPRIGSD